MVNSLFLKKKRINGLVEKQKEEDKFSCINGIFESSESDTYCILIERKKTKNGRRRNKSLVAPVHRLQATESATISQQLRRSHHQSMSQPRPANVQSSQCQTNTVLSINAESTGDTTTNPRPNSPPELTDAPSHLETSHEGTLDTVSHAQLMRLGGLTKYGMWASFGLTTISVAATKFYVDHQGTFEILLLCTLGVLSAGLLVSCILTVCKRSSPPPQFVTVQAPQSCSQPTTIEMAMPEVTSEREIIISPLTTSISQHSTMEARPSHEIEQPPPPYDIAILLPIKDCIDYPPPSYENAVR